MAPDAKRWVAMRPQVGNLSMPIKDAEDQLSKIIHGTGTELVEDASHFDPIVGVRIASIPGCHQQTICLLTDLVQVGGIVMAIPRPARSAHLPALRATGQEQADSRR
jgi:hypothetical protein